MHIRISPEAATLISIEIHFINKKTGLHLFNGLSKLICLLHMIRCEAILIISIIRHECHVILPTTRILVLHIRNRLIHHLSRLRYCTDWKAPDTQTHLISAKITAGIIL